MYEDGTVYSSDILDMNQDALLGKFFNGVRQLAAVSLAISYPTAASVSHSINFAYKQVLAIALQTEIDFPEVAKFREYREDTNRTAVARDGSEWGGRR